MFRDRHDAGRQLAFRLQAHRGEDAVVLGLPRGGVPVAADVARALGLPLDILVVRKLGAPVQQELGMGAVAEGGVHYIDPHIVREVGATQGELEAVIRRELAEVERRVKRWRGERPPLPLAGKTCIVVDDGIATGGTVRAALLALRQKAPARIVLAVPVAPVDTLEALRGVADEIVCVEPVYDLWAIGAWYEDFAQVPDDEVTAILDAAHAEDARPAP